MQLHSGHQCRHTGAEYVLHNFICQADRQAGQVGRQEEMFSVIR